MTKLLTSGILFSTTVNAVVVAKPLILGALLAVSVILILYYDFSTSPLVSGIFWSVSLILFSEFDLSVSYLVFKTNPLVLILFDFATNLSYTVFLTITLFTTVDAGFDLPISILSTSDFKLPKSDFSAYLDVSIPAAFFKSVFVA